MNFTFDELEAFIAVVDTGSISAAAIMLGQPNSTTSRLIARLEDKLNTTLLRRTTRRLDLTDEGCSFLHDARHIVAAAQNAQERLQQRHGEPSGPLKIDTFTPFMLHIIAPLVSGYRQRFPQVELQFTNNEGYIDLLERRVDLAFRAGELKDSGLNSRLICHCKNRLVASPDYLARCGMPLTVEALTHHALIGFSDPDTRNNWPLCDAEGKPFHARPAIAAASGEVIRRLALHGEGIACVGDFATLPDIAAGKLVEVLPDLNLGTTFPISAVFYKHSAVSNRISSFLDYILHAAQGWEWAIGR